ncbi:NifB/NifX family molybdenum-iron cluster-binding protein [Geomonas sp.]|uniref:NifB/NifX family molybdenum-iron cluster-binding protein n=1 Tax=Geomonas sp. TaxID=2651584 RepID=UPI002B471566|nr:NifB/NifX family molybdenum-iron cluster-binding protein [Geomonas sp.]HJV36415.1 NifB/NifX family molybdenum-iron cluster-binding protein [Geomonas sp.]
MKICFPTSVDRGLASDVFGHFGSAPVFVIVDAATNEVAAIGNGDRIHQHGACNPLAGLGGQQVDAIVVGEIGRGALFKLNNAGIRVFQAHEGTIAENMALFRDNRLPEYLPTHTCGGHGHGGGCSH